MGKKAAVSFDPEVAKLFDHSLGPSKSCTKRELQHSGFCDSEQIDGNEDTALILSSNVNCLLPENKSHPESAEKSTPLWLRRIEDKSADRRGKKRKRTQDADDLEGTYLRHLIREEAEDDGKRTVELHEVDDGVFHASTARDSELSPNATIETSLESKASDEGNEWSNDNEEVPQHESIASSAKEAEFEKASRTVFLANVSTTVIKSKGARRTLLNHLMSSNHVHDGPKSMRAIESIRFRSTPFNDGRLPRKAAYAKKELMDSTAKSTNAYVIYKSQASAREAVKLLNGTVVLDRHLRVDSVAHPALQDHRRCVFVGNLGFVDDESAIKKAEDENDGRQRPRKAKEPADYEEGLWKTFMQAGKVESVRLIRDKTTRVGKGFAYVQFYDANAVEKALLYHDKNYPPMLPRKLRVVRARKSKGSKTETSKSRNKGYDFPNNVHGATSLGKYHQKTPPAVQSFAGRAKKLLGRAAAARYKGHGGSGNHNAVRVPKSFVFEGHRASRSVKMQNQDRKREKPKTRSSRRGTDFKRRNTKS